MSDFTEHVTQTFLFKWQARMYMWRARRRGFKTRIYRGARWPLSLINGAWCVKLSKGEKR